MKQHDPNKSWITNRIKSIRVRHIVIRDEICQLWIRTKSPEVFDIYKMKRNEVNEEQ